MRTGLALTLASAVLTQTAAPQQTKPPTIRSAVDVVELNVAVTDGKRQVVNLTAADFQVTDNGVPQQVISVTRETLPIDITLVVDTSESVSAILLEAMANAAKRIRDRLRADDRVSLITFNHRISERIALSVPSVVGTIPLGRPTGQTSLNDSIAVVLAQPPAIDRRQMMIVFTDGFDSTSILSEPEVLAIAGRSNTAVFAISRGATPRGPAGFFDRLAAATGGFAQVVPAYSMTGTGPGSVKMQTNSNLLDEPFLKALDDFRSSYVLRYSLTGVPRAGWHTVTVKVAGRNFVVRTRSGYAG